MIRDIVDWIRNRAADLTGTSKGQAAIRKALVDFAACGLGLLVINGLLLAIVHGAAPFLSDLLFEWIGPLRRIVLTAAIVVASVGLILLPAWALSVDGRRGAEMVFCGFVGVVSAALAGIVLNMSAAGIAAKQRLGMNGERIYWCGGITEMAPSGIAKLARSQPGSKTLVLMRNGGGMMDAAYAIAAALPELGIERVEAVGYCNSACAVLWMLAPARSLAVHTTLGFHTPHRRGGGTDEMEQDKAVRALVGAGVEGSTARELIEYADWDMGFLSAESRELSGVVFELVERRPGDHLACRS